MKIQAQDIMKTNPLSLTEDMSITAVIDLLIDQEILGAPVVNKLGNLLGFLSLHDVMVDLWCQDYAPTNEKRVADLMKSSVISIDVNEPLLNIIETLCIDKEQLFPISSMGIGIQSSMVSCTLEERAKKMKVTKPKVLPVLNEGVLVGVVTRLEAIKALRYVYEDKINVIENINALDVA